VGTKQSSYRIMAITLSWYDRNRGSIPRESTSYGPLVKWISFRSSKPTVGVRSSQGPPTKGNMMKTITLKNKFNGEKVVCKDIKEIQVIDGIEYILVSKTIQDRKFLMRKDALERVKV